MSAKRKRTKPDESGDAVPGPPPRKTRYCPYCNARGLEQPILSPLIVMRAAPESHSGKLEYRYACQKCDYEELHPSMLD